MQWYDGGEKRQRSTGSEDRRVAMAELKTATATIGRGGRIRTVGESIGLLYRDYERRKLKSYSMTRQRIEANVLPWWSKIRIDKISATAVDAYAAARAKDGAKPSTINRELSLVRRALTLAHQAGKIAAVPFIRALPEPPARSGFVDQEQFERLRDAMPEELRCLVIVAYMCGCRLGELLQLRWDQVDYGSSMIRLEANQTKSGKARVVPIYPEIREALQKQPRGVYVFTRQGKPIRDIREGWRVACAAAGVPGLLFHDLRRSAVRNMERLGFPRGVAMSITGHSTESVYRRYNIVSEQDITDAIAKFEHGNKTATRNVKKGLDNEA